MIGFFTTLTSARLTAAVPFCPARNQPPVFIRMRRKLQNQHRVHVEKNGTAESTIIGTMPALP